MRNPNKNVLQVLGIFLFAVLLLLPQKALPEERPSVMFMIAEQNIGQEFFIYWWGYYSSKFEIKAQQFDLSVAETILQEAFINEGFEVIDISNASDKIKVSKAYKIVNITKDAAIEMGKNVGADVVVKGRAIAKLGVTRTGSNIGTYMADITATAFQVRDGRVLGAGRGHGVARHISEITGGTQAIERAAQKLAEKLMDQINTKMGR